MGNRASNNVLGDARRSSGPAREGAEQTRPGAHGRNPGRREAEESKARSTGGNQAIGPRAVPRSLYRPDPTVRPRSLGWICNRLTSRRLARSAAAAGSFGPLSSP